jgi:hypothetical protein
VAIGNAKKTLAMVSVYSPPHVELLTLSYHTLWSSMYQGDVKLIAAVVVMVPHQPFPGDSVECFFVLEKPGIDVASLGGSTESVPDKE